MGMKIIIVGCGKVGTVLAAQLGQEGNDICVVDLNRDRMQGLVSQNDIMGVCGNGSNYAVLAEAGIAEADLFIAVTGSDVLNLLCCVIAQKTGHCKVIARVRNPLYQQESEFLRKELGLTMIINPELLAAEEMFHILRFPNANEVDFFSRGQVEMIRFRIPKESMLDNLSIREVADRINNEILIGVVERENEVLIPNGDTVLHSGDSISILTTRKSAVAFFRTLKSASLPVKNTMIVGGGQTAVYLARMLVKSGISVKLIEQNRARCEELAELIPEITVVHGDGSDRELLREERIEKMDSFVALTNFDEENILLSLYAKKFVKRKVVTKINRFQLNEVIYNLDLDSVVYPKHLTSERLLQYARAQKSSIGSNIQTLYRLCEDKVEVLEFLIKDASALTAVPIYKLRLKSDILIGSINRAGKSIIPKGQDQIQSGDSIIIVTTRLGLKDALDILER